MRIGKKRAAFGAAAVSGLMALTACTGTTEQSETDIHLRMTMWSNNPVYLELFNSIAADFMAGYPAVTEITFESLTLDQLDTVITTNIQGGTPPDLTWLPVESSAEYIKNGALLDVAPTVKATEGYDFDDLVPGLQERWRVGDAQYGIPFSTGPLVLYYNADLYAQAGVKSPADLIAEGNWTWEAFREISKELADKTDVPGYVLHDFDFKNWTRLLPVLYAYGASPWSDDAASCTADTPEFKAAISLFHDMVFTDGSSPLPGQQADFWGGQAGATTAFLGSNSLLKDATFEYGIVPTPAGPAGQTVALGQASIVALAAGKHRTAALDFLAFLTNKENGAKIAQFFPPARASLLEPTTIVGTSTVLTPELVTPILDGIKSTGKIFPVAEDNAAVTEALNSALDEFIYTPDADIDAALARICSAVAPLL